MSVAEPPVPEVSPTYPDLQGKVALITGIGQVGPKDSPFWGNGAATARLLSRNGVKIFGCDLNLPAAERTKERLLEEDTNAVVDVIAADVMKPSDVEALITTVMQRHGRIDILVNNVGQTSAGNPATMSEELWARQIDLNLSSVYRVCHHVLPIMQKQRSGSIINNASITAMRYIGKHQIAYAAAKAGVIRFTKAMGVMYAKENIRSNCVVPGLMYTPLVDNFAKSNDLGDQEAAKRILDHNCPMGWMGTGADVANAVVFLASSASRYVTSHELVVDGGITESTGTGFQASL
ncbi:NAD(P)-binding protein [Aaosphaeria arxii CBS 175.79]|uniref:NAD(P)-binding protein n=1 Tax=Aaosphaeria arxii CBS 175.79 TaxID=1450172 RepID=A0A6A5Y0H6_9PLEO|nr:NAD(P)-binding protein [Aaosphaeria arxii CBS 175.79]KAF2018431.1 NAD(P)-binding protein [Aaosphaeria arxii CBS 175.79]